MSRHESSYGILLRRAEPQFAVPHPHPVQMRMNGAAAQEGQAKLPVRLRQNLFAAVDSHVADQNVIAASG